MKKAILTSAILTASALCAHATTTFYSGVTAEVNVPEFFPLTQLISGSGSGFEAASPHDRLGNLELGTWVTNGSGSDYFGTDPSNPQDPGVGPTPVIIFDLGSDVLLSEISTWGYNTTNGNGAREFSLRFATVADGMGNFADSIIFNPSFVADLSATLRDSNVFGQEVTARWVELTITDNYFTDAPGGISGGDRVGLGEVAFAIPEPGSFALLGLAGVGLLLRRKRS